MPRGLCWVSGFSSGKREVRGYNHFTYQHYGLLYRSPYSDLPAWGVHGNLQGSTTGNLTVMEGGGGYINQHMDLSRPSLSLQCPSSNPEVLFCSSAESNQGWSVTKEVIRVQICLILIFKWILPVLEPGLPMPRERAKSQPQLLWGVSSTPVWLEGLATIPGSIVAQWHSSWEVGRQSWSSLEQSHYQAWSVLVLHISSGISS